MILDLRSITLAAKVAVTVVGQQGTQLKISNVIKFQDELM